MKFDDVKIKIVSPNVIILIGGFNHENPKSYMDKAVKYVAEKFGHTKYNQFIESYLDNPWVRIVTFNFDEMEFKKLNDIFVEELSDVDIVKILSNMKVSKKLDGEEVLPVRSFHVVFYDEQSGKRILQRNAVIACSVTHPDGTRDYNDPAIIRKFANLRDTHGKITKIW